MKIVKYALLALLLVSVYKKAMPSSDDKSKNLGALAALAVSVQTNANAAQASIASQANALQEKKDKIKKHMIHRANMSRNAQTAQAALQNGQKYLAAKANGLYTSMMAATPGLVLPSNIKLPSLTPQTGILKTTQPNPEKPQNIWLEIEAVVKKMESKDQAAAPAASTSDAAASPAQSSASTNSSEVKKYNSKHHIAVLKNGATYINVKEYKQAVTPPNIAVPVLQRFATVPNKSFSGSSRRMVGGQFQNIVLFGIPVFGKKVSLYDASRTKIGSYWPESEMAQLFDGTTVVMIKQQLQDQEHKNMFATGPAYTWYTDDQIAKLKQFGVSASDLKNLVNPAGIGSVTVDDKKYTLFGVALSSPYTTPSTSSQPAPQAQSATLVVASPQEAVQALSDSDQKAAASANPDNFTNVF